MEGGDDPPQKNVEGGTRPPRDRRLWPEHYIDWDRFFYHATVDLSFQIEISNLDRTESRFLVTSLYRKVNITI